MRPKYLVLITAALLSASSLTSCGADTSTSESNSSVISDSVDENTEDSKSESSENDSDESDSTIIASNNSYTVFKEALGEGVYYPQIKEMNNEAVQNELNEKFLTLEHDRYAVTQNYTAMPEVLYSDDTILCINQVALFEGGSSETILSIDMQTGKELELSDVTDINSWAEKLYNNNGITILSQNGEDVTAEDFIEEHYFSSVEDVANYLETYGKFKYDENKNLVLMLSCSSGRIEVSEA